MKAYIIIDAQNEFSDKGERPVPEHSKFVSYILKAVEEARNSRTPIAWVKHFNKPFESPAFVRGSWGASFTEGMGAIGESQNEAVFEKEVYGAFTGTDIGAWLKQKGVSQVIIMGFYTHGCVSTTSREAIMQGLEVVIHSNGTGSCDISDPVLGNISAAESKKAALLHLSQMGAIIV
jgi:nicotinamidase-related amidase